MFNFHTGVHFTQSHISFQMILDLFRKFFHNGPLFFHIFSQRVFFLTSFHKLIWKIWKDVKRCYYQKNLIVVVPTSSEWVGSRKGFAKISKIVNPSESSTRIPYVQEHVRWIFKIIVSLPTFWCTLMVPSYILSLAIRGLTYHPPVIVNLRTMISFDTKSMIFTILKEDKGVV